MPIEILMPALSPTMEEGTLAKWLVKEGDEVSSGDLLAEIETDKATMEVEAVDEGTVGKILVAEGSEGVRVNAPIAVLLEDGESADDIGKLTPATTPKPTEAAADKAMAAANPSPRQTGGSTRKAGDGGGKAHSSNTSPSTSSRDGASGHSLPEGRRVFASPLARRLAEQSGIQLTQLTGTGPNGRIVKRDVLKAQDEGLPPAVEQSVAEGPYSPERDKIVEAADSKALGPVRSGGAADLEKMGVVAGSYSLEPLDGMRRTIASRLLASHSNIPDFPLMVDCEIDELLSLRKQLNAQAPEGVKISVNDMIIRASALALKHLPESNASFTPDGIAYHRDADVAVAVAVEGGLITPIVRQAQNKGLSTISEEIVDLASRARERKLKPHEYQGGTFAVSNLGMFGIKAFGSIINEPHGMILSVGAGEPRPVVRDGEIVVRTVMTVTLTCDHRVVDGALGARWLKLFKDYIQTPITMML